MSDFVRRTLRTWAVACLLHGLAIAAITIWLIPWKTPAANAGLLAWALLTVSAAPGLWLGKRWGWGLGAVSAAIGLLAAVVAITGLILSWAYLRGIYGEFGTGASIGALLVAALVFEALGIVPALLLRALLRREVRAELGIHVPLLPAAGAMLLIAPIGAATFVGARYELPREPPLSEEARSQTLAVLRAALDGAPLPEAPALAGTPTCGPVYATIWSRGSIALRVAGEGADLKAAVEAAAASLASRRKVVADPRDARIKVDRVTGSAPLLSESPLMVAISVRPGIEGLRRQGAPAMKAILADDMLRYDVFGRRALEAISRELRFGLDSGWALRRLGSEGGRIERFRTEGWVEHDGGALPVTRGNTAGPAGSAEAYRAAAIAGGEYLLGQQLPDGSFNYQYFPFDDRAQGTSIASLPRHAGASYALAQLAGATRDPRFAQAANRALEWMLSTCLRKCGPDRLCLRTGSSVATLGQSALGLIALLELQKQTGEKRFEARARKLAEFLLSMQRPDGEMHHSWSLERSQPVASERVMFASEQAMLAFVLAYKVFGEQRFLDAARRGLEALAGPRYDYFLGRFIYGSDHWYCLAAREAWPHLKDPRYLDYCLGYTELMGRTQFEPGAWENEDFAGFNGVTALLVPQSCASAAVAEAVAATHELARLHGRPSERVDRQLEAALDGLMRVQLRGDNAYMVKSPQRANGGVRRSLIESEIRLDYTQHALSALLNGATTLSAH